VGKTRSRPTGSTEHRVHAYARKVVAGEIVAGPIVRDACKRHLRDLDLAHQRGVRFDAAKADRALNFFPTVLRLNGGQFEGLPFELVDWQAFIVGSLFGWIRADGSRRFRVAYIEASKGCGKALALDTPIPTPSGWTTMGELQSGDQVIGADGRPCRVVQAHPVSYDSDCYEVEFDDGSAVVASAEHLWFTEQRNALGAKVIKGVAKKEWGRWHKAVRTTAEIASTLRYANGRYQSANHSVPLAGALDLPHADLPISPYVLGAWLGDGDSDCARLTCAFSDIQVIREIEQEGEPVCEQKRHSPTTGRFSLSDGVRGRRGTVSERLRALGLFEQKRIPRPYLRASREQRLALLQGLMDTDGTISASGTCEFSVTQEALASDVLELIVSLGIKAGYSEGDAKLYGRKISTRYRIQFSAPHLEVFRLSRKQDRNSLRHNRRRLSADRRIVNCRRVDPVPVRCITVDSPDSMFLCGRSMIPTHNSPLVAGVGLYGLICDDEPRAEVYSAASKKDQAMILFRDAVAMVEQSPALKRRLKQSGRDDKVWNLYDDQTNSFFRPISADQGQSGPRPHIGLIDELHEHKNASVINLMSAGRKWRRQPLIVAITNSGHDRTSVCWEYHEMARQVCAGSLEDDTFFAFVCGLDEGDDPFESEACWIKANPSLGVVITEQYLRDEVNQARGMPSKESTVRRLNFCEWTEAHDPFVSLDSWKACAADFTLADFAGAECYVSLDLSSTTDLTAATFLFLRDGMKWWVPMFWIPADGLADRVKKDKVPYDVWARQGHVLTTPGKVVDKDYVAAQLAAVVKEHGLVVREVAYDRWRIHEFQAACKRADIVFEMVEFGQGYQSMAPALDAFETDLTAGTFRHPNNPVLNWNAASAVVTRDPAGNRKLDKAKATGRIDGMVAGVMAHGRAALKAPEPEFQFFTVG
jgi:phage terminase large subunit-like protein